jgi:Right handed beta helix region
LAALPVAGVIAAVMAVMLVQAPAVASHDCPDLSVEINPGNDLDAIVNGDPRDTATTFCVHAGSYTISQTLQLRPGDKLMGQPGSSSQRGLATDPNPVVQVVAGSGVQVGIRPSGGNDLPNLVEWIDLSGAKGSGSVGTGVGIAAGSTDGTFVAQYNYIHHNDAVGISGAHGRIMHNEFEQNTLMGSAIGKNGAGVKGGEEYEAANNYVHDEQGNGLWCDSGCDDDPTANLSGFWVHHNLLVNNDRAGVRYENSANAARIEWNNVHGNGTEAKRGGVDIHDAQDAVVANNVFGPATIADVSYGPNAVAAIRCSDSGRSGRPNLQNVVIEDNNVLNGETIRGC